MCLWKSYRCGPRRNLEPSEGEAQSWGGGQPQPRPNPGTSAGRFSPLLGAQCFVGGGLLANCGRACGFQCVQSHTPGCGHQAGHMRPALLEAGHLCTVTGGRGRVCPLLPATRGRLPDAAPMALAVVFSELEL